MLNFLASGLVAAAILLAAWWLTRAIEAAAPLPGDTQADPQLVARVQAAELLIGQLQTSMEGRFRTLSGQLAQAKYRAKRSGPLLDDGDDDLQERTPEQEAGIAQLMAATASPIAAAPNPLTNGTAPLRPMHRRR